MQYALNLMEDGRILSASFVNEFTPINAVLVNELPQGNIYEYCFINGEYIHNPLPKEEEPAVQTLEERTAALEEAINLLLEGATE